ncbi:MAG: hypothetical protein MJ234_04080 [bacterium]|nr:hypothetical protein [bacterium]
MIFKSNCRGISLVEALLSTAIFSFVSVILFTMTSDFFKSMRLADSSQSMNQKFIQADQYLNRDLRITDSRYIYSYTTEHSNTKSRWIMFPIATDDNGNCSSTSNRICWSKVVIYYLSCSKSSCSECSSYMSPDETPFKNCCDKNLIRLVYNYAGSDDPNIFSISCSLFAKDISSYLTAYKSSALPDEKSYTLPDYGEETKFKYSSMRIAAREILDLKLDRAPDSGNEEGSDPDNPPDMYESSGTGIKLDIFTARTEEAAKQIDLSSADYTGKDRKYLDSLTILVYPRNGRN